MKHFADSNQDPTKNLNTQKKNSFVSCQSSFQTLKKTIISLWGQFCVQINGLYLRYFLRKTANHDL